MSETNCEIETLIDELAGMVMMATPEARHPLTPAVEHLQQIATMLREDQPAAARIAQLLGQASKKFIAGENDNGNDPLETLACGVAMLQSMNIAHERNQPEIFPSAELLEALAQLAQEQEGEDLPATPMPVNGAAAPSTALIERQLAALEEAAQAANLDDLSTLAQLQLQLEEIYDLLGEQQGSARQLSKDLQTLIDKLILEECADPDQGLAILGPGVELLQRLHADFLQLDEEPSNAQAAVLLADLARVVGAAEKCPEAAVALIGRELSQAVEDDLPEHPEDLDMENPNPQRSASSTPFIAVDADIFSDFRSEADEHLRTAENTLLALENNPQDAELLNTLFRSFHTIKGASGFLNLHDVTSVAHAVEDVLDSVRKQQLRMSAAIADVTLEGIDLIKALLETAEQQIAEGTVQPRDVSAFVKQVAAAAAGKHSASAMEAPREKEEAAASVSPNDDLAKKRAQLHVRVDTEKLDVLVNTVGELVIAQTQVAQNPDVIHSHNQKLGKDISQLLKISTDLQEISMALRMVPIKATFERMARMVRDLARKCGKQIDFKMQGEDTELDKNVIEEIVDPLTHMVRNAVDHGIETAEERRGAGKPENGRVTLSASHKGGHIVIELRDNGRGINTGKVLHKAIDRGLVKADEELSDREIQMLIFHPGLSTAEKVSNVSGRGVGMDVVRRNIEHLRGKVEVESEEGRGSLFTIKLPLTLAIIDGMVIGVGQERYILPLTSIVSSLRPRPEQIATVLNRGEMIKVQDELFPLLRLHERFNIEARHVDPCKGLVVLIESEGTRCCILVDELVGLQQVVIKGLEENLRRDPCLAGCAILGDGRVGLILDANGLVADVRKARNVLSEVRP